LGLRLPSHASWVFAWTLRSLTHDQEPETLRRQFRTPREIDRLFWQMAQGNFMIASAASFVCGAPSLLLAHTLSGTFLGSLLLALGAGIAMAMPGAMLATYVAFLRQRAKHPSRSLALLLLREPKAAQVVSSWGWVCSVLFGSVVAVLP
jgi:hypothetical protein